MGHTPSGARPSSSSTGSGRGGYPFTGFGRGRFPGTGRGSVPVGSGRGQQNFSSSNNHGVPGPAQPPAPESLPRPGSFSNETPTIDELQSDPRAAQLLQEAMAVLRRNKEQKDRGVVTVSTLTINIWKISVHKYFFILQSVWQGNASSNILQSEDLLVNKYRIRQKGTPADQLKGSANFSGP